MAVTGRITISLLLTIALLQCWAIPGQASDPQPPSPYIPASLYPAGSHITFNATLSNAGMDQQWNKDYTGAALMHRYSENSFLREAGWMEQGFLDRSSSKIAWFLLFDSSYGTFTNGDGGNLRSYLDLQHMLTRWWHAKLALHQPDQLIPTGFSGNTETRVIPKVGNGPFLVTSVYWGDKQEIEAMAFTSPKVLSRTKLRQMLYAQVAYAASLTAAS